MNKIEKLKPALAKISRLKREIAAKRDELRSAVFEIQDILESMDEAVAELEDGGRCFERAVESMSQYL